MIALNTIFNKFQIIGIAKGAPDYEEGTLPVGFDGVSGSAVFGNHTEFISNREIRQGDKVVIGGHITAMFDGTGELFPVADVVCLL